MNKAERAVIMAAGFGSRLMPLTKETPKPLIKVNGVRMIDSVIKALHKNGVNEIYIVVGYLKEKFDVLKREYSGIELIENPYYDTCNNISSLYVAREHLENSLILDGDQIIYNDDVLSPYFEKSGYNSVWTDGKVISCSRTGGKRGWQLFSISRWNEKDGKKLKRHLELEFENKQNRGIYWDDVVMFNHFDEYDLTVRPMNYGDVIEIDSLDDLMKLDLSYKKIKEEIPHEKNK